MHINYTHVHILRKKYLHTGRYLFIKGKKYIYAKRGSVVKNKDQYFNCKPVFRKKYAFRMRYSHNNVVHHCRSTNSALATKDRLREIGDRSVYRTIDLSLCQIDQWDSFAFYANASRILNIVLFKRLSRSREIHGFLIRQRM